MSQPTDTRLDRIFSAALDEPDPQRRKALVEKMSQGDRTLSERVLVLLNAAERASRMNFMETLGATARGSRLLEDALGADEPQDLLQQIGDYVVERELGRGGMGVVYKARKPGVNRAVAIKRLYPGSPAEAGAIARFRQEIDAQVSLEHPNVVRVYDVFSDDGIPCLVMEYVQGQDLETLVECCGPIALDEACDVILQAAKALQCVHEHKLVHRDIKPSNLMIATDGTVKLLDLGLASPGPDCAESERLTEVGMAAGTVDYMAPEQFTNMRGADIRADIYSLGCTFYFLLAGHAPFEHKGDRGAKLIAHQREDPPPIVLPGGGLPAEVERVLGRMMAKDRTDRFANPAELVEALKALRASLAKRPERGRRWLLIAVAAMVTVIVAASLAAALLPISGRERPIASPGPSAPSGPPPRPAVGTQEMLSAMTGHLDRLSEKGLAAARRFQVFFTLTHLHNNWRGVPKEDLEIYRTALEESLQRWSDAERPARITWLDEARTVCALDLRDLSWQQGGVWNAVSRAYPYGVRYDEDPDPAVAGADRTLWENVPFGSTPYVRADWFVAAMSQPPLEDLARRGRSPQPLSQSARWVVGAYDKPLNLAAVAAELGQNDLEGFQAKVRASAALRNLGLESLLQGGTIDREAWSSTRHMVSACQEASTVLNRTRGWKPL